MFPLAVYQDIYRLKEAYDRKYEKAAADYLEKAVRSLKKDDPGRAYRCLKKLAAQPGDYLDEGSFTLLSHSVSGTVC